MTWLGKQLCPITIVSLSLIDYVFALQRNEHAVFLNFGRQFAVVLRRSVGTQLLLLFLLVCFWICEKLLF